jgi:hypothetical protein
MQTQTFVGTDGVTTRLPHSAGALQAEVVATFSWTGANPATPFGVSVLNGTQQMVIDCKGDDPAVRASLSVSVSVSVSVCMSVCLSLSLCLTLSLSLSASLFLCLSRIFSFARSRVLSLTPPLQAPGGCMVVVGRARGPLMPLGTKTASVHMYVDGQIVETIVNNRTAMVTYGSPPTARCSSLSISQHPLATEWYYGSPPTARCFACLFPCLFPCLFDCLLVTLLASFL